MLERIIKNELINMEQEYNFKTVNIGKASVQQLEELLCEISDKVLSNKIDEKVGAVMLDYREGFFELGFKKGIELAIAMLEMK
ncbi:hypothetical protein FDB64_02055 [Clostridium botulinum]|nr:hypothetical protein [Clostridium botulinum]NFM03684.1 hypothetical protein [Clostridium botulinum]